MKTSIYIAVLVLILSLSLANLQCIERQKKKMAMLEDKIALLKETYTPIRFKVLKKTEDSIRVAVKFYDVDKNELNMLETTLPGSEISFDFFIIPVKNKFVAFPSLLFSNSLAASEGMKIYALYDNNGFPDIYNTKNIDSDLQMALTNVFSKLKNNQLDSLNNYFGNMVHDIKDFKEFVPQQVYSIVTHTKGGIEIVEE